jgi:hypothetical protein
MSVQPRIYQEAQLGTQSLLVGLEKLRKGGTRESLATREWHLGQLFV